MRARQQFPPMVKARARKMIGDGFLFAPATKALQKAVDQQKPKSEKFWRAVFAAYAQGCGRRWKCRGFLHIALAYAQGRNPSEVLHQDDNIPFD